MTGEVAGHRTRRHLSTPIFLTLAAAVTGDPGELATAAFAQGPRLLPPDLRTRFRQRVEGRRKRV